VPVRVLLIDPDDAEAARLEAECRGAAAEVDVARAIDAPSARDILGDREIDLVVGDIELGEGVACAEPLRGHLRHRR
jgi:hypothetical protein